MEIVFDFFNACKRSLRESAHRQKYRKETKCTDVVRRDSELHSQTKNGDIGRVRIELENFYMGEPFPGGRRRGDQAHEGESLRILRFCTVRWKNTPIPQIRCRMGTSNFVVFKTDISAENWMESMEDQWNSSGRRESRSRSPLCISASPTSLFLSARARLLASSTVRSSQSSICSSYLNPEVYPLKSGGIFVVIPHAAVHWSGDSERYAPTKESAFSLVFSVERVGRSSRSSS